MVIDAKHFQLILHLTINALNFINLLPEKEIPIRPSTSPLTAENSAKIEESFCSSSDSKALINRDNSGDGSEPR